MERTALIPTPGIPVSSPHDFLQCGGVDPAQLRLLNTAHALGLGENLVVTVKAPPAPAETPRRSGWAFPWFGKKSAGPLLLPEIRRDESPAISDGEELALRVLGITNWADDSALKLLAEVETEIPLYPVDAQRRVMAALWKNPPNAVPTHGASKLTSGLSERARELKSAYAVRMSVADAGLIAADTAVTELATASASGNRHASIILAYGRVMATLLAYAVRHDLFGADARVAMVRQAFAGVPQKSEVGVEANWLFLLERLDWLDPLLNGEERLKVVARLIPLEGRCGAELLPS